MIRKLLIAAALLGATTVAGAATPTDTSAPTLTVSKGTVMVSNGSQFVTAQPGQVLKPGDRVMVMQGGSATVNYGNGHTAPVLPGTMADIGTSSAIAFGAAKKVGPMYAQAVGDKDDCRDSNGQKQACARTGYYNDYNQAGLYAALIGGLAVAVIINASGGSHHPISSP